MRQHREELLSSCKVASSFRLFWTACRACGPGEIRVLSETQRGFGPWVISRQERLGPRARAGRGARALGLSVALFKRPLRPESGFRAGLSGPERREQKRLGARGIQLSALDHIRSGRSVAEVPTLMQRVEIHIDGWPRADWTVYQEVRKVLLDGR